MPRNANASSQPASSRAENSSEVPHPEDRSQFNRDHEFEHRDNYNSSHPDSDGHSNPAIGAKNNGRNISNGPKSPQNLIKMSPYAKSGPKHGGNISRVREEGIDLRGNKPLKGKSKPSHSPQRPPELVEKMHHRERYPEERGILHSDLHEFEQSDLPEEEKMRLINANMSKLSESIVDLRQNYSELQKQEEVYEKLKNSSQLRSNLSQHLPTNHPVFIRNHSREEYPQISKSPVQKANQQASILTKSRVSKPQSHEQILKFLLQKQRQKEERKKIIDRQNQKQQEKLQKEQLEKISMEEEYLKWRKNQIRQAGNFEEKHKRQKESEERGKQVLEEFKKRWEGKERFHKKKEKQYSEKIREQEKQMRDMVISQKKELFKPHSQAEIEEHEKWYFLKMAQLQHLKQSEKEEKLKKIEQQNLATEHYHGNAHNIISQELREQKNKKILPFKKAQKIRDYKQYVHQNFSPRVHKSSPSADNDNSYDPNRYMKVKRYRYYKGHSYGQISETQPVAKNAEEVKRMGDGNMEFMKKIPKKRHQTPEFMVNSYVMPPERQFDPEMVRKIFSDAVESQKEKKIKLKVPENFKVEDLQMFLGQIKSIDTKLDQKQKSLNSKGRFEQHREEQKQLNQSMVDNMQRKLSLLSQL